MRKIIKNIICFLFINFLANIGIFSIFLLGYEMFALMDDQLTNFETLCIDILAILLIIGRLFVLPIAYKILEDSKNFIYISKFIKLAKNSIYMKIGILFGACICYWIPGFQWFSHGFNGQFILSLFLGLLGSYLILFAYWFVEDKIKNWKRLRNE